MKTRTKELADGADDRRQATSCIFLYKLIGDEDGLVRYFDHSPPAPSSEEDKKEKKNENDWSGGAYFQLNPRHCLGTLGYRWDKGYMKAQILRIKLEGTATTKIRVVPDEFTADPNLPGEEKARRIKWMLNLNESEPLVAQLLGRGGSKKEEAAEYFLLLLLRETDDEWEMVSPLQAVPRLLQEESLVCEFRRPSVHPWVPVEFRLSIPNLLDGAGAGAIAATK